MGNRPGWISEVSLFQGEQTLQETRIPTLNVNEKWTEGESRSQAGPRARRKQGGDASNPAEMPDVEPETPDGSN